MVVPLRKASKNSAAGIKPVQFYGNSLPRPRFYANPQFNSDRVDPPVPVLDPLLSWARDAHWSMGGLSFTRLRHQGRIEGNVSKLRAQREKLSPMRKDSSRARFSNYVTGSDSPPPAPMVMKRRRFLDLNEEGNESGSDDEGAVRTRRKLVDEFDRVAKGNEIDLARGFTVDDEAMDKVEELLGLKGRSSDAKKNVKTKGKGKGSAKGSEKSGKRSSPRLAKRRFD